MLLRGPYSFPHDENRMQHEGDVRHARQLFYESRNKNLWFLLRNRFQWMNQYIEPGSHVGVELGAGQGFGREVIQAKSYVLTDFNDYDWLDVHHVDALNTPFEDDSFDFVIASNMIHHVPYPARFFDEVGRILKPGGLLLVQDVNCSLLMRILLRVMRIEGWSFEKDVFDRTVPQSDTDDLWAGNNAVPNLLFDDQDLFESRLPAFRIEMRSFSECLTYLASGGVTAKTFYLPLPYWMLRFLRFADNLLTRVAPQIFALQRQVVVRYSTVPLTMPADQG